jgi:uncharacterized membrane protein
VNALLRTNEIEDKVLPWGLAISVITAVVVGASGFIGGELSYKHMIGVNPRQREPESPIAGSRRRGDAD